MLTQDQIQQLLSIIEHNTHIYIAKHIGPDYLTAAEKANLRSLGINAEVLYSRNVDFLQQSFYFGLISDAMKKDAKKLNFDTLRQHFVSGKHIPLTKIEINTLDSVKKQFLGDIKANKNRIFSDVNNIISNVDKNNRLVYEKVIRDEIIEGISNKKLTGEIARDLARKTGDWNRDFDRIVEYVSHYAYNEGRLASSLKHDSESSSSKVWFDVYPGACKHCITLYLTAGYGSQPIIFDVDTLKANGTNIGKKQQNWKATISGIHPYCRCSINNYVEGTVWNPESGIFDTPTDFIPPKRTRLPIEFEVDGKLYAV